jgi:hypothetical protein
MNEDIRLGFSKERFVAELEGDTVTPWRYVLRQPFFP